MQERNEKMTRWRESVSLNHEKNKKLFSITDEIKKVKIIGKKVIKESRIGPASSQKDEAVQHTKFMNKEANKIEKRAMKFHLLDATPEFNQQLDTVIEAIKDLRKELDDILRSIS